MKQNSPEYNKFREDVFTLHAVLGIAALKAIEVETFEGNKEFEKIRHDLVAYYNKYNKGLSEEYIKALEDKQEHLQKIIERFVKKNVK